MNRGYSKGSAVPRRHITQVHRKLGTLWRELYSHRRATRRVPFNPDPCKLGWRVRIAGWWQVRVLGGRYQRTRVGTEESEQKEEAHKPVRFYQSDKNTAMPHFGPISVTSSNDLTGVRCFLLGPDLDAPARIRGYELLPVRRGFTMAYRRVRNYSGQRNRDATSDGPAP